MKLRFCVEGEDLLPSYGNDFAAGLDLRAAEDGVIGPYETRSVSTGVRVEIPAGHVGLVRGRSGLAFKRNVVAFEGTIDEDYRGPIHVLLEERGGERFAFARGERVAQLVIVPVVRCRLERCETLGDTVRGENGFGSTGIK